MNKSYTIRPRNYYVNDVADNHWSLDVLVASGDCLAALATQLDGYAVNLPDDAPLRAELDTIVSSLLYLQHNYQLVKK